MAGHSKFKNIQHRKGAQDKKRAKIFTKIVREIITAAKIATDPASNPRLRSAITTARAQNVPKERIDKAITQAADPKSNEHYFELRYEGFAPGGVAIIVEALTDNKNRTTSEVRASFTKFGGHLGETGSVNFMFEHVGIIQYPANIATAEIIFESAIVAQASDIVSDKKHHIIYTSINQFSECLELMTNEYGPPESSYIGWKPQNTIVISTIETAEKLLKLVEALEENDDVQQVFGNYKLTDKLCNTLF